MLEKKKINAKKELEDQKANAAIQRKQGKDSAAIKAEMELKEAQKAAIERKAGEPILGFTLHCAIADYSLYHRQTCRPQGRVIRPPPSVADVLTPHDTSSQECCASSDRG